MYYISMSFFNANKVFYMFNIPVSINDALYIPNISFEQSMMGQYSNIKIDKKIYSNYCLF